MQASEVSSSGTDQALRAEVVRLAAEHEGEVIGWRRDIHQHPELSNREFRTSRLVAEHLRRLGFDEVRTGVAHTGVVGVLRGGRPGTVVALRADMDALPIAEQTNVPFASRETTTYNGLKVGVMHACGHDAHTAILMGAAQVLAAVRLRLPGTVVFLFQPAEEGPPLEEGGGAKMMIAQGALDQPHPQAIFGLHVSPLAASGTVGLRPGALMGDESNFRIVIHGRQTHAGRPWHGIDPITVAAQVILALQTIPSRQLDQGAGVSLITIGTVHGGTRRNIIPDEVELTGTFRTLNAQAVDDAWRRIRRTVEMVAGSAGATATVDIVRELPITYNDPDLASASLPTLTRLLGSDNVQVPDPVLAAEDFAFYQEKIPGLFLYLGVRDPQADPASVEDVHSSRFMVFEPALNVGVRTLSSLAVDYLLAHQ
ncbi:MAG TPA: amidohydrolase [Steroidobacteraceae bacterium]|nr:amidohydrolase [Steroidobacteraceae bacterium]